MNGQTNPNAQSKIHWMDNLRTFAVFLVVVLHAGLVYESSGFTAFFWIVDDPSTNQLSGILNIILDIFVMSTIFFVSGYLTPGSIEKRTTWGFLKSKAKRLMIPWAIAVLTLIPLYKVLFLYSRGLPQEHWTGYFHWNNIWNQNWLWFLPVLFLFDVAFLPLSRLRIDLSGLSLRTVVLTASSIGLGYCLVMDWFNLQGWTDTFLLHFQNERLLIYFLVFLVGAFCYRRQVFQTPSNRKWVYWTIVFMVGIPINVYITFVIYPFIHPNSTLISAVADSIVTHSAFVVSLLCLLYLSIETFRRYVNQHGFLARTLSRNSYSVYVIHTVVLGVFAILLLGTALPSLAKQFLLVFLTYSASTLLASGVRRISRLGVSVPRARHEIAPAGRQIELQPVGSFDPRRPNG